MQKLCIRGWEFVILQFRFDHPLQSVAAQRLRLAANQPADKKFQADGLLRIVVGDGFKEFADGDGHAEFLVDFAGEALLEGFVRFAFAAGEFPQPAQMGPGVAPGDEQFAAAKDEGGGNFDDWSRVEPSPLRFAAPRD